MSVLIKSKSQAQAYDLEAVLAPAHWFFCRRIEIPADLEKGEEEGYALLELENLSPFPLDHLYYGYRLDEGGRFAFVFAAYKRRFEKLDSSGWRRVDAVLPDFLIGLHPGAKQDGGLILVTEKSLVAFSYDSQSSLPGGFYAEARSLEEAEEGGVPLSSQIQSFSGRARQRLGLRRQRMWRSNAVSVWVGKTAWFSAVDESEESAVKVSFTRDQIWKADLRDAELVEQVKRDDRQNAILWKGLGILAALVCLVLLGEVYFGASRAYLSYRESKIEERAAQVAEVESLQSTSVTLRDFLESDLAPFQMIEALLPMQQYPNIIYKKFVTAGPDVLEIDARAANQTQVTEFKKRLERFDKVTSAELSKLNNQSSGSTFTVTIRFKYGAFFGLARVSDDG